MSNNWFERSSASLAAWLHGRRTAAAAEAAPAPHGARGHTPMACASVVIPALNEAERIAGVVAYARADPATAEVIVIDDSSINDTAALAQQAGARVARSTMLGKGASMRDGVREAEAEFIVYLDGDFAGLQPGIASELVRPLLAAEADFVKARFGRGGGRVIELTAKPMLKVFFPEIAAFAQPLGGIAAARRSLLASLDFEDGWGADVALMIDAQRAGARPAEVDIGRLEHDSQPLADLAAMANEVAPVICARARAAGRLNVDQIGAMVELQRQAAAAIDQVVQRRRGRRRLLLLDLDGTAILGRFVAALARATGRDDALAAAVAHDAAALAQVAAQLRFVHCQQFERVARALPPRPGVIELVNRARRGGFMVGVLGEASFDAAEIVRRRIFADFAIAHTLRFDRDVCTGELNLNPPFTPLQGGDAGGLDKVHVLQRFRSDAGEPPLEEVWAVGDDADDLRLLRAADRGFVVDAKSPLLAALPNVAAIASFGEMLRALEPAEAN
jgi:phosphoserine phosphatase